jgi:hypothetical protein
MGKVGRDFFAGFMNKTGRLRRKLDSARQRGICLLRAGERLSGENLDRMARFYVQIAATGAR